MTRRANILARLRRWRNGAARQVVAALALAYLTVGLAPCATAATEPVDPLETVQADADRVGAAHAHHDQQAGSAHDHHGTAAPAEQEPGAPYNAPHCPHCPAGEAIGGAADHSSCFVLEDLTTVAASHSQDAPQTLLPSFSPAAFTLPPPLASPAWPSSRAAAIPPIPLNLRHCVFLI